MTTKRDNGDEGISLLAFLFYLYRIFLNKPCTLRTLFVGMMITGSC